MNEAGATQHQLPLASFLIQTQVIFLWLLTTLATWVLLLVPPEHFMFGALVALYLIFAVVFVSYGFDVVEQTALGRVQAPSLLRSLRGPRLRLFRQVFVIAFSFTLIEFTPADYQWLTISLLLAVAPAISSFIVFHDPLAAALDPRRIWQFISNMGFGYVALRLMTTSILLLCLFIAGGKLELTGSASGKLLVSAGTVLLVLMMFRATGTLLHLRREQLGIRTEFSTEQLEQQRVEAERLSALHKLETIKQEFRRTGTKNAYRLLELELKRHKFRDDALYYSLLKEMADRRLLYRFAGAYIGRLIEHEPSHAWGILIELHKEARGEFQLQSGTDLFRLVPTAETRVEREVLCQLMEQFEQDFPTHPRIRQALLHATELRLRLNDKARAQQHFQRLQTMRGDLDLAQFDRCGLQLC